MTPYLQFRLWLKEASGAERRGAGVAVVIAAALVAWALVPPGSSSGSRQTLATGFTAGNAQQSGGSAAGSRVSGQPAAGFRSPASGGTAPVGSSAATGSPGAAAGAAGSTANGSGSPTTAGGGPAGAPGATPGQPLTATDRGVTSNSIKVGFTILNLGGVNQAGIAENLRTDTSQVIDAIVDNANKQGGVLGRKIVADKQSVDIISPDDQRAKCLQMTQTDKVFAVVDTINFVFRPARACVTAENKTPLVTLLPGGSDEMAKAYPYQASLSADDNRVMTNYARGAQSNGFFSAVKGFHKLGILDDNCDPTVIDGAGGLKANLRAIGISSWSEYRVDCAIDSQERDPPAAVLQFRQAGVTNVMFVTTHIAVEPFMNTAQAQGWHPKYFASDYEGLTLDIASHALNQSQADGMEAMSEYHSGDPRVVPAVRACSKILVDHNLAPITSYNHDFEAITLCENLDLFLAAARAAGPNLTRVGWGQAVQTLGKISPGVEYFANFDRPGKMSGGDAVALATWQGSCSCWKESGIPRASYG